jgi:4-amino-4-deoxy-L-arabinose transferase-like glycosyltransferase
MSRQRTFIGLQFAAGLMFIGLGHFALMMLDEQWRLGAYGLYLLGAIVLARVWLQLHRTHDANRAALNTAIRTTVNVWLDAWRFVRSTLRDLWPFASRGTRMMLVVGLNVLLAGLAILLPGLAGAWLIGSLASLLILIEPALLQPGRSINPSTSIADRVSPPIVRWRPNVLGLIAVLILMSAGQIMISSSAPFVRPAEARSPAYTITNALHLDLVVDPETVLGGAALLMMGVALFTLIAWRGELTDRVEYQLAQPVPTRRPTRWRERLLLTATIILWLLAILSIVNGATGWAGVLPWLMAIGLCGLYWWRNDRRRGVRLGLKVDRTEVLLLSLAALALVLIFSYRLGDVPASIGADEGDFFSMARGIAFEDAHYDFFGMGVYTFPIPSSLYQSLWLKVFGANVWAWRFGSVVAAVLGMLPVYFLARMTLGRRVAWLSLALYATLPYLFKYARMGYNNTQAILPVGLTLLFLWLAVRRDSRWYSFLAGCAAGLGFLVYSAGKLGAVLGLVLLAWWWVTRQLHGRTALALGAVFGIGVVLVAGPSTVYGIARYPDYFSYKSTESLINNVYYGRAFYTEEELFDVHPAIPVGGQELFFEPGIYASLLARGIVRTALGLHMPTINDEYYLVGALADPIGIIYLVGIGWCLTRLHRSNYALWLGWFWGAGFFLGALTSFPPRGAHLVPIIPALAVLGALGIVALVDAAAAALGNWTHRLKNPALVASVAACAFVGWRAYFVEMPLRYPPTLENVMFWQMQQLPRGTGFVLIKPDDVAEDFAPWKVLRIDTGQIFHLVKPADLAATNWQSMCPQVCRIFFTAAVHDQVETQLEQALGKGTVIAYSDAQGVPQAYSFEPTRADP